jgi:hypothetical protein
VTVRSPVISVNPLDVSIRSTMTPKAKPVPLSVDGDSSDLFNHGDDVRSNYHLYAQMSTVGPRIYTYLLM